MNNIDIIKTLDELRKFANDKGIIEIVIRGKKKKFKAFQKIALDQLQQNEVSEKIEQAIKILNKNNQIGEKGLRMLGNVSKLNKFNLVLNGLNLCATCAGFAIMYEKLDKMSAQIAEVVVVFKESEAIHANYEFKKILSEHSNMLDCRKKQSNYTEDQMRELVDGEYNVLELLVDIFLAEISNNREELLFSILSLAQMLSASVKFFDEIYYFENKEAIGDGDRWHIAHDKWVAVFDKLSSSAFIDTIQDLGMFEMGLNTVENDRFYIEFYDQIRSLKQDIEDNQTMIIAIDDRNLLNTVRNKTNEEIQFEIESALKAADVELETVADIIRVAVA